MTKQKFNELCDDLRSKLEPGEHILNPISTELSLSMTLRYLAGGHVYDIIDLHGVAYPTFYEKLSRVGLERLLLLACGSIACPSTCLLIPGLPPQTLQCLDETLQVPDLVTDTATQREVEAGFAALSDNVMRGCIGGETQIIG